MTFKLRALAGAAGGIALLAPLSVLAHGVAGDRVFPATLAVDDPAVSDEMTLPQVQLFKERDDDGRASRTRTYSAEYDKRITDDFGISVEDAYVDGPEGKGFDNAGIGAKYQLYRNDPHEILLAAGLDFDIGGTGRKQLSEDYSTATPEFFFGKGLGDLPDSVAYLRPFAVTGELGYSIPLHHNESDELNTGLTLQYSLPYLQQHVKDIGLPAPLDGVVPLVEFAFDTPVDHTDNHRTVGTINPGFIWMGKDMQFGLEAVLPLNHDSGQGVGVVGQVHIFFDDLLPKTLGRPIF